MSTIDCSLVSEGPTDVALLPIIRWAVAAYAGNTAVEIVWADLRRLRIRPRSLAEKITEAVSLYPCDILFVHRDADRQPPDWRKDEIDAAISAVRDRGITIPYVCVIPVREQEAWLLIDSMAIRQAANNPNGSVALDMPRADRIEGIPDPKQMLYELLKTASGLQKRRLRSLRLGICARRVSEYISDMSALRGLTAFQRFESDVRNVVTELIRLRPTGEGSVP